MPDAECLLVRVPELEYPRGMLRSMFRIWGLCVLIAFIPGCKRSSISVTAEPEPEAAKIVQAKAEMAQIVVAVKAYYTEYGRFPPSDSMKDTVFGSNSDELFNVLAAVPVPPNINHTKNPRRIVFIPSGKQNDPWGNRYLIAFDSDYDNQIAAKAVGYADVSADKLKAAVVVWSYGRDGKPGTNGDLKFSGSDDLASW
jgi:hypothetical protein